MWAKLDMRILQRLALKMVIPVWGIIMSPIDLYSCFYWKLNYGYQISGIFIGSPDTGYQLIYLHYQIRSMNTSSNKNFPSTSAVIKNRLAAELTSRYSGTGTGPKYKRNSPLLCSECFRITNTSAIVIKNFFLLPRENFPCCWRSACSETHFHSQEFMNLTQIICFLPALDSASDLKLSIITIRMYY